MKKKKWYQGFGQAIIFLYIICSFFGFFSFLENYLNGERWVATIRGDVLVIDENFCVFKTSGNSGTAIYCSR